VAVSSAKAGALVGSASANGYLRVSIDGTLYYLHRLTFLYVTGAFPVADVDHVDGDRSNNRWANLRQASRAENLQNLGRSTSAKSGVRNVYFYAPSGKWQAKVTVDGRSRSFGYFQSIPEAAAAAAAGKREMHAFSPEHRA
jgi:hypothetical protein